MLSDSETVCLASELIQRGRLIMDFGEHGGLLMKDKNGGWLFADAWCTWTRLMNEVVAQGGKPEYLQILSKNEGEKLVKEFASQLVSAQNSGANGSSEEVAA